MASVHFPVLALFFAVAHGNLGNSNGLQNAFDNFDKNGEARRLWLERYRTAKSQCTWKQDVESLEYKYDWFETDATMRASYWGYLVSQLSITTYYPVLPRWLISFLRYIVGVTPRGQTLSSQSCIAPDSEGEFRIRRLGPFLGNGGFDWHKMKLEDPYNLRSQIPRGNIVYMTGFMVLPVDENGEVLGNPPIHIHHANLGPNHHNKSLARVSQWHGDSQCAESDGGTACYVTTLPRGFGFPVSEELRLDVDFNDLRPSQSPDLHFWLETAIHVAHPPEAKTVNEVGTVIIGAPFRMNWWKTSDFQRLYFVPPDHPTALWATARMPTAGSFVGGKLETHQHMFDVAWIFSGVSPEDLGLNSDAWHLRKPWLPWLPSENGWSDDQAAMRALKSHVMEHFEDVVQRCAKSNSCEKAPTLVWTLNNTVFEDGEEREMPWPKGNWSFEEGEQFTQVIFHKAMAHTHGHSQSELPQHLAMTGHYLPKEGTHAGYHFVLPTSNADWAWINSVNWFSALTHCGGMPVESFSWLGAFLVLGGIAFASLVLWINVTVAKRVALLVPWCWSSPPCDKSLPKGCYHYKDVRDADAPQSPTESDRVEQTLDFPTKTCIAVTNEECDNTGDIV